MIRMYCGKNKPYVYPQPKLQTDKRASSDYPMTAKLKPKPKIISKDDNMRSNQIEIKIRRYGDVIPESYGDDVQVISVYADSDNLFEALSAAYGAAIQKLQEYERFPAHGCLDVYDNHSHPYLRFK